MGGMGFAKTIGRRGVLGAAVVVLWLGCGVAAWGGGVFAKLEPKESKEGYLARLLINEVPFPGERGFVSEEDTKTAMREVLWVLHGRTKLVPAGYKQEEVGGTKGTNVLDFITARRQCEGFMLDAAGRPATAPRVDERVAYLLKLANSGSKPGRFANLLNYAQELARRYFAEGMTEADVFAGLTAIGGVAVTGRPYSWMAGQDMYHPGGSFVKIPDSLRGLLGGNRFFTLQRKDGKE